jgi:hypothetical protein
MGAWRALGVRVCAEGTPCAACVAGCALRGAIDARFGIECEATAGRGPLRAARRGARGRACARVMSRRRAMVRCCRWRIGRRTTCCVRNVRAHRAVRPRCGRVRVCGAKRALCCVRSVARKVLRAPRVAQGAARSARGPKASARRRRAELPAASRRVGAVWLRGCEVASGSAQCAAREAWRAKCCVRCVLRTVRCDGRASRKRV